MNIFQNSGWKNEGKYNFIPNSNFKKVVKKTNKELQLCDNQIIKINNIIIPNFSNLLHQSDIRQIILSLSSIFHKELSLILNSSKGFQSDNKNKVCSFLNLFFEFYEDFPNAKSNNINDIIQNAKDLKDSFIISLCKILIYTKNHNAFPETSKNDDIKILLIKVLNIFYKIDKYFTPPDEETKRFVNLSSNYAKRTLLQYLSCLLDNVNKVGMIILIENYDEFTLLYKNLSRFKEIRKCIYDNIIKMRIEMSEREFSLYQQFIDENGCINDIFTAIKDDYLEKRFDTISKMLNEMKNFFIIQTLLIMNDNESTFQSIILIINEITHRDLKQEELDIIEEFLQDFFKLSIVDPYKVQKKNFKNKHINTFNLDDFIINNNTTTISNISVINNLIELFNSNENIREQIVKVIVDNVNNRPELYENIVKQTEFIKIIVGNLYQCKDEAIMNFSELLFSFLNNNIPYSPKEEIITIISTLGRCKSYKVISFFLNRLRYFTENKNDNKIVNEINTAYIQEVLFIIKNIKNDQETPNFSLKKETKNAEINENIIPLISFCNDIIKNSQKSFETFKKMKSFIVLNSSKSLSNENNFQLEISYAILKILIENEEDSYEIINLLSRVFKRYECIYEIKIPMHEKKENTIERIIEIMKEINVIKEILIIFFVKEKNISNKSKENILNIMNNNEYFYKNENIKQFLNNNWSNEFQDTFKVSVSQIITIMKIHNMNMINHKKSKNLIKIKFNDINNSLNSLIIFLSNLDKNEFLLDMIKYIIDKALDFKYNEEDENRLRKEQEEKLMSEDFITLYANKFKINIDSLESEQQKGDNHSNFIIQSAFIIMVLLLALIKVKKFVYQLLGFIEFICKVNKIILKMFLRNGLLEELIKLLEIANEDAKEKSNKFDTPAISIIKQISSFIVTLLPFLQKSELLFLIDYIILNLNTSNNNNINECISQIMQGIPNAIINSSYKGKEIVLTNRNIRNPNYYNLLYSPAIYIYSSEDNDTITIAQIIKFNISYESMKFTLLKIEKENSDNLSNDMLSYLDISIEKSNVIIKDNKEKFTTIDIVKYIPVNQTINLVYVFKKSNNTIDIFKDKMSQSFISCKNVTFIQDFFSNNINSYNISVGFQESNNNSIFNNIYENFPSVSLLYMIIYNRKIDHSFFYENACILNRRTLRTDELHLEYLNVQDYEKLSLSSINMKSDNCSNNSQKNQLIEKNKIESLNYILFELFADKIDIIKIKKNNNQITENKDNVNQISIYDFFKKIQRKLNLRIIDKQYIQYIPLSNYSCFQCENKGNNDVHLFFNENTYLISSFNLTDTLKFNCVLEESSIKIQIKENIIFCFGDNNLMISSSEINLPKYIILLLNNLDSINNNTTQKEIFSSLILILYTFLIKSFKHLEMFANNKDYLNHLFVALYKNSHLIDNNTIDSLFFLSFAYPEPINNFDEIKFSKIFFPFFITDLLLSPFLFESLSLESKTYLIRMITKHILDCNNFIFHNELKTQILSRLSFILLKDNTNSRDIDKLLIDTIILIVRKILLGIENNPVYNENNFDPKKTEYLMSELIEVFCNFEISVEHLVKDEKYKNYLRETFTKLFIDDKQFFHKKITEFYQDVLNIKMESEEEEIGRKKTLRGDIKGQERAEEFSDECWITREYSFDYNNYYEIISFIDDLLRNISNALFAYEKFKDFISNVYTESYIRCLNSKTLFDRYSKNTNEQVSFSYYLIKSEGPFRIRKRYQLKPDNILNYEIDHSNINISSFSPLLLNKFTSLSNKMQNMLNIFISLESIYKRPFYNFFISDNIKTQAFNCILFNGMRKINSIFIFTKKSIVIITNVLISNDGTVYSKKKPISNVFWVLKKFDGILFEHTKEENNDISIKEEDLNSPTEKFKRNLSNIQYISFSYLEINEIHKRKFLHQENALEIFLNNGINYYFAFNLEYRDSVFNNLIKKYQLYMKEYKETYKAIPRNIINNDISTSTNIIFLKNHKIFIKKSHLMKHKKKESEILDSKQIIDICQSQWLDNMISNFEYIMLLNTVSGRTYNDVSQYPVLPWILSDYSSELFDLTNQKTFRDLKYPIYAQSEERRKYYESKFQNSEENDINYHSGSHYSNPGFIGYYTLRIKPFSIMVAEIQGNRFDTSYRLFYNIKLTYDLDDKYQELIPEVFTNPEILINSNNFIFAKVQGDININDVILPKWAKNSPRIFIKIMQKAFETTKTNERINEWIDLIFGCNRKGKGAIEHYNVLRKVCSAFEPNKIYEERIEKNESEQVIYEELDQFINEIYEMGQNPLILFSKPHPKKEKENILIGKYQFFTDLETLDNKLLNNQINEIKIDSNIKEIYSYYESQDKNMNHGEGGLSSFRQCYNKIEHVIKNKNEIEISNLFFIIGEKKCLLPESYKNYIDWSMYKYSFRIVKPFKRVAFEFHTHNSSPIATIQTSSNGKFILVGYVNGLICKYKIKKLQSEEIDNPIKEKKKSLMSKIFKKSGKGKAKSDSTQNKDDISTYSINSNHPFKSDYPISSSNIQHYDSYLSSDINFIQLNPQIVFLPSNYEHRGYWAHSPIENEIKNLYKTREKNNSFKKIYLFLINSNKSISNEISIINICDCFSLLIVVDVFNFIYLFDFISLTLLRTINYNIITKSKRKIKFISICELSGDFIAATSQDIVLFNLNGVPLTKINFTEEEKIIYCLIKSIKISHSDINLFTLHTKGIFKAFKVMHFESKDKKKEINNNTINPYRFAYNAEYYQKNCDNDLQFNLCFNQIALIKKEDSDIQFFKITEDLSKIMFVSNKGKVKVITFESFIKKKFKIKSDKKCGICNKDLNEEYCYFCNKKICVQNQCKYTKSVKEMSVREVCTCNECYDILKSDTKLFLVFN